MWATFAVVADRISNRVKENLTWNNKHVTFQSQSRNRVTRKGCFSSMEFENREGDKKNFENVFKKKKNKWTWFFYMRYTTYTWDQRLYVPSEGRSNGKVSCSRTQCHGRGFRTHTLAKLWVFRLDINTHFLIISRKQQQFKLKFFPMTNFIPWNLFANLTN